MKLHRVGIVWAILAALICGIASEFVGIAAEPKKSAEQTSDLEAFRLPETKDAAELIEFLQGVAKPDQKFSSPEEEDQYQQRTALTMIAVADRLLPQKSLSDDDTRNAAFLKIQGQLNLAILADFSAPTSKQAIAAVDKLRKDSRPIVAELAEANRYMVRIACVPGLSPADRDQLIEDVIAEIQQEKFTQPVMELAQRLGGRFARMGDEKRHIAFSMKLAEAMRDSGDEQLMQESLRIEGQLRQMQLPGKTLELAGTTSDGEKFDWKSYEGKVVLVSFWATYCEPCKQEMKNILRNYKKYHDKGFDVVGISVDPSPDKLDAFLKKQKLPWTILYERDEDKLGMGNPLAIYYGVQQLPTAMLVDQEGKVVSLQPFGPELTRLLDDLLGAKE